MTDKHAFEALLRAAINAAVYNGNVHGRGGVVSAEDRKFLADQEAAVLAAYDAATKPAPFKPTGNPELDAVLLKPDPEFWAFVASLPANYWARYDLSAVRLGWHFGRADAGREGQSFSTDAEWLKRRLAESDVEPQAGSGETFRELAESIIRSMKRPDAHPAPADYCGEHE